MGIGDTRLGGLEDACQVASYHLCRAAAAFEPARGYKFSTLATYYVRHGLDREFGFRTAKSRGAAVTTTGCGFAGGVPMARNWKLVSALGVPGVALEASEEAAKLRRQVRELLGTLQPIPRLILRLRFVEGMTLDEIAGVYGGSVKKQSDSVCARRFAT